MKTAPKRWGEVTIKKLGIEKNKFDKTKSFSIDKTEYEYTVEQLRNLFSIVVDLSEKYPFDELKRLIKKMK